MRPRVVSRGAEGGSAQGEEGNGDGGVGERDCEIKTKSRRSCETRERKGNGQLPFDLGAELLQLELTSLNLSVKVDGSILGNSLSATGSNSSMNGMMRKTEKGIKRSKSWVVLLSCLPAAVSLVGLRESL